MMVDRFLIIKKKINKKARGIHPPPTWRKDEKREGKNKPHRKSRRSVSLCASSGKGLLCCSPLSLSICSKFIVKRVENTQTPPSHSHPFEVLLVLPKGILIMQKKNRKRFNTKSKNAKKWKKEKTTDLTVPAQTGCTIYHLCVRQAKRQRLKRTEGTVSL